VSTVNARGDRAANLAAARDLLGRAADAGVYSAGAAGSAMQAVPTRRKPTLE
jgi:hypothetical protein